MDIVERWKDMWNRDVEGAVRWVQGVDLGRVGEGLGEWGEEGLGRGRECCCREGTLGEEGWDWGARR